MAQTELSRTALAVGIWRREHSGRPAAGMPAELQRNVVKLLETYSWEEVCKAVGIGRSSLAVFRRRHREHLQLRRRIPPPKRARRRGSRLSSGPKKGKVRLAQVVCVPDTAQDTARADGPGAPDGKLVLEVGVGGVRVGVLDGFSPSTLGAVLDVLENRRQRDVR